MKRLISLLFCLLLFLFCKADYDPLTFADLIEHSKAIVVCKTVSVNGATIEVEVLDFIKGAQTKTKLTVSRFYDWTCASRWASYKVGQLQLLFLTKGHQNIWYTLGTGNEGDMPIQADTVYYKERFFNTDSTTNTFNFDDGIVTGHKYSLTDVKLGIMQYFKDKNIIRIQTKGKATRKYIVKNVLIRRIMAELREKNGAAREL